MFAIYLLIYSLKRDGAGIVVVEEPCVGQMVMRCGENSYGSRLQA